MSDRSIPPTEAAHALQDVERRRTQAAESPQDARWVDFLFAAALFALMAGPDFFGEQVRQGISWGIFALLGLYAVLLRTRRGSALIGRQTRIQRSARSWLFAFAVRFGVAIVVLFGFLGVRYLDREVFPYAQTVAGALLCAVLLMFGRRWHRALISLTTPGKSRTLHGSL